MDGENMENRTHMWILLGLFLITALFASGSVLLIKKRVGELPKTTQQIPTQQQTSQQIQNKNITPPTPTYALIQSAQGPSRNTTASPSAQ